MIDLDFSSLFDATTLKGLVALVTLHAHLAIIRRRVKKLEPVVKVLVDGHTGGVQAHRDLVTELPKAEASR